MRVAVLTGRIGSGADADDQDTLDQAEAVRAALSSLGHEPRVVGPERCLLDALRDVRRLAPAAVFNLAETVDGRDDLAHVVPDLLAAWGLPFTGSGGRALLLSNDKPVCKRLLIGAGLPTPPWVEPEEDGGLNTGGDFKPGEYIVKPGRVHASKGIDADSVVACATPADAARAAAEASVRHGRPCFAEKYVPGREFAVSLLASGPIGQPEVMPPAEMLFLGEWQRPILTYAAKWDPGCREYADSARSFDLDERDAVLAEDLCRLALRCWRVLGLSGYARVDFRVDETGRPWAIDVNANPCLAPDAGFPAACGRAGLAYEEIVRRVLEAAASGA